MSAPKGRRSPSPRKQKLPAKATRHYEEFDWYETPKYYDAIFDVDSHLEGDFLEAAFEKHATPSVRGRKRVLEPACGSGRLMVELAGRGWKPHGFDLEPNMVTFTKERLAAKKLGGTAAAGNMAAFTVRGTFDLAHCFVSTFKYLLSEDDARGHLESVARSLRAGGIYALGFHLSEYGTKAKLHEKWQTIRDGANINCTISSWPADQKTRLEKVQARMKVIEDGVEKRAQTTWHFRTYSARQVRSLLRSVPDLEHVATYDFHYEIDEPQRFGDHQLDTILILRKRA